MNKIKIPIGDWSDDGHGKCLWYLIETPSTVKEVREFYFNAVKISGIDFTETFCSNFEDNVIPQEKAELIPFSLKNYSDDPEPDGYYMYQDDFVRLFLDWIKYYNPEFKYSIVNDEYPMLPFFGFDEQGRHIGHIGYGLFYL